MTIKQVADKSGFNKLELAVLYGVTRQMIHYWLTVGGPRKRTYTARMEEVITLTLMNLIAAKALPWGAMSKDVRAARVKHLAKKLQDLKPAPLK